MGISVLSPASSGPTVNYLNNGGMQVWQRGTSFTPQVKYSADRWYANRSTSYANATVTRQSAGTGVPTTYCLRMQRTAGTTGVDALSISQALETVNSIPLAGQTVTLSFWARKGANYSATTGRLRALIYSGTGTDEAVLNVSSWAGSLIEVSAYNDLTTSWARYSVTTTLEAGITQIAARFMVNEWSGTAGAADYAEITGIQLERGASASEFQVQSYAQELQDCQRYAQVRWYTQGYAGVAAGVNLNTTETRCIVDLPVPMRIAPTSSFSGSAVNGYTGFAHENATDQSCMFKFTGAVGLPSGDGSVILANPNGTSVITITADL